MFPARHGSWCQAKTHPTRCPSCKRQVFYFSCSCGSRVFFEKLGEPWPKHFCDSPRGQKSTRQRKHKRRKPKVRKAIPEPREPRDPWDLLAHAFRTGTPITGTISKQLKNGFEVTIKRVPLMGFLPAGQIECYGNRETYIGKSFKMKVIRMHKGYNGIHLSRLAFLKDKRRNNLGNPKDENRAANVLRNLKVGQPVFGIVRNVTDFGVFVDLDGIDGLLHNSRITQKGVMRPSHFSVGKVIEVVVISIDTEAQKIGLGLRQNISNPWRDAEKKYIVGSIVQGKVVNIVDFGVFLSLEAGIEGLIHISELADRRIGSPAEIVSMGEELKVKIINVDIKNRRIGLSLKALLAN